MKKTVKKKSPVPVVQLSPLTTILAKEIKNLQASVEDMRWASSMENAAKNTLYDLLRTNTQIVRETYEGLRRIEEAISQMSVFKKDKLAEAEAAFKRIAHFATGPCGMSDKRRLACIYRECEAEIPPEKKEAGDDHAR